MRDEVLKEARILVVDDQEANVRLVERILEKAGYTSVRSTTDSREVVSLYAEFQPDLMILDLLMPHLDGFDVMQELSRIIPEGTYVPILVLTADDTREAMYRALSMGARDFLTKPFDPTEALLRIRNLLETRYLHISLEDQDRVLEEKVAERTKELKERLEAMTKAAEHRRMLLSTLAEAELSSLARDVSDVEPTKSSAEFFAQRAARDE
jgi:DNA-binding response OmpR family regulator